ncbi:MAG: synthase subunit [Bacteroidota bacterium]
MLDFSILSVSHRLQNFARISLFCAFFGFFTVAQATEESHNSANSGATTAVNASDDEHAAGATHQDAAVSHGDAHAADAYGTEAAHGEKKFEPGKMIMDHISDAHDWHLWGEGHGSVSIPLPVIIYSKSKGVEVFSSAKFNHGHDAYNGYRLDEENHVIAEDGSTDFYDLSITKNVLAMFIGVITLFIIAIGMANSYKKRSGKAPKGFHNLVEPLILFIRDDIAKPSIGHKANKFMPLLLSIFFFIFVLNLYGLIPIFPGGANVTGNIAVTMVLAVVVFLTVNLNANKYYWKHIFVPDVPVWMYPIIIPIEILGVILKPFVLMLRLFANITAGHLIILGFFSLIFIFGAIKEEIGFAVTPLSVGFTVFMSMLELLVAFLQAFVFTLLTSIYIGMAVEDHHH